MGIYPDPCTKCLPRKLSFKFHGFQNNGCTLSSGQCHVRFKLLRVCGETPWPASSGTESAASGKMGRLTAESGRSSWPREINRKLSPAHREQPPWACFEYQLGHQSPRLSSFWSDLFSSASCIHPHLVSQSCRAFFLRL